MKSRSIADRLGFSCGPLAAVLLLASAAWAQEAPRAIERIAFGSCARQYEPQPIWDKIVALRPQLFLMIGDNIYADTEDMQVLKAKYAQLAAQPGFQKLRATCPVLATWDDHDYGANDAGAEYPKRAESQQVFLDFFRVPADSPRRKRAGVYDAQVLGPPGRRLQIILLDTRYFRSPLKKGPKRDPKDGPYVANPDPAATMLGEAQWKWLAEQLRTPAEIRIIASSVQVVGEDHRGEKWANFPRQRERLFKLLRDSKAAGVIFISGDRHMGELTMMDAGIGYPLYDLTSSGMNCAAHHWRPFEPNRHRVGTMNWGDDFGAIMIDWSRPDPRISLQIRDADGDIAIQRKIFRSTLQPGVLPIARP